MYPTYKLFALLEGAERFGISPARVLHRLPFSVEDIQAGTFRTSIGHYVSACKNAAALCADPELPLSVGRSLHLSAYGLYGFALMSGATVRSSFEFAVRYHMLATPMFTIDFAVEEGQFIWLFPNERFVPYPPKVHNFLLYQQLAQHITHIQDMVRTDRSPLRIEIALPEPTETTAFDRCFAVTTVFGAPATKLIYDLSVLDERPPHNNPISHTTLRESCDRLLGKFHQMPGVAGQVARIIMESPVPFPAMNDVADQLAITTRTLRRRLSSEETTFSEINDQVRNTLAKKYLEAGSFSVDDIAELVGFSDAANFRSSFKRWNGVTPSEYRRNFG